MRLAGLPFSSGFFSKDIVIELGVYGHLCAPLTVSLYLATALTAAYSLRSLFLICSTLQLQEPLQVQQDTPPLPISTKALAVSLSCLGRSAIRGNVHVLPQAPPAIG